MQSTYDRIHYYKVDDTEKARIISKIKTLLGSKKEVKLAWLFGSITRRSSIRDVDVAIYAEPEMPFKDFLYLNAELETEIRMPVDLVEIKQALPSLKERVLKKGFMIKGTKMQCARLSKE